MQADLYPEEFRNYVGLSASNHRSVKDPTKGTLRYRNSRPVISQEVRDNRQALLNKKRGIPTVLFPKESPSITASFAQFSLWSGYPYYKHDIESYVKIFPDTAKVAKEKQLAATYRMLGWTLHQARLHALSDDIFNNKSKVFRRAYMRFGKKWEERCTSLRHVPVLFDRVSASKILNLQGEANKIGKQLFPNTYLKGLIFYPQVVGLKEMEMLFMPNKRDALPQRPVRVDPSGDTDSSKSSSLTSTVSSKANFNFIPVYDSTPEIVPLSEKVVDETKWNKTWLHLKSQEKVPVGDEDVRLDVSSDSTSKQTTTSKDQKQAKIHQLQQASHPSPNTIHRGSLDKMPPITQLLNGLAKGISTYSTRSSGVIYPLGVSLEYSTLKNTMIDYVVSPSRDDAFFNELKLRHYSLWHDGNQSVEARIASGIASVRDVIYQEMVNFTKVVGWLLSKIANGLFRLGKFMFSATSTALSTVSSFSKTATALVLHMGNSVRLYHLSTALSSKKSAANLIINHEAMKNITNFGDFGFPNAKFLGQLTNTSFSSVVGLTVDLQDISSINSVSDKAASQLDSTLAVSTIQRVLGEIQQSSAAVAHTSWNLGIDFINLGIELFAVVVGKLIKKYLIPDYIKKYKDKADIKERSSWVITDLLVSGDAYVLKYIMLTAALAFGTSSHLSITLFANSIEAVNIFGPYLQARFGSIELGEETDRYVIKSFLKKHKEIGEKILKLLRIIRSVGIQTFLNIHNFGWLLKWIPSAEKMELFMSWLNASIRGTVSQSGLNTAFSGLYGFFLMTPTWVIAAFGIAISAIVIKYIIRDRDIPNKSLLLIENHTKMNSLQLKKIKTSFLNSLQNLILVDKAPRRQLMFMILRKIRFRDASSVNAFKGTLYVDSDLLTTESEIQEEEMVLDTLIPQTRTTNNLLEYYIIDKEWKNINSDEAAIWIKTKKPELPLPKPTRPDLKLYPTENLVLKLHDSIRTGSYPYITTNLYIPIREKTS